MRAFARDGRAGEGGLQLLVERAFEGLDGEQSAADSADEGARHTGGEDGDAAGAQLQAVAFAPGVWY